MKPRRNVLAYYLVMVLLSTGATIAWNSVGPYTHEKLTDDAIKDLSSQEYPDIYRFAEQLRDGSEIEASHNDPTDGRSYKLWGPEPAEVGVWWADQTTIEGKKGALRWYKEHNFAKTYLKIGYMLHLVQDWQVPAHWKKCAHGYLGYVTDDFEDYADNQSAPWQDYKTFSAFVPQTEWRFKRNENDQWWYYWLGDEEDDDDENNEPDGPGGGGNIKDFDDGADGPSGPSESNWGLGNTCFGSYGFGDYGDVVDILPGRDKGKDRFNQNPNVAIAKGQLKRSYDVTISKLQELSRALPPLIPNDVTHGRVEVSKQVFGPQDPTTISFIVVENRKAFVYLTIRGGDYAIRDMDGYLWLDTQWILPSASGTSNLPWKGEVTAVWRGAVEIGELNDGLHQVRIRAVDWDQNPSDERTVQVRYDKTKPGPPNAANPISISLGPG
ncbi:MAG: hypothetical protein FJ279_26395 [Planctomycetes bacterium]|nr:hypothetical protein [Planctomycetota bacterium]